MGLSETNIDSEKIVWNKLVPFSGRGACSCVVCVSDDSRTATEEKKNKQKGKRKWNIELPFKPHCVRTDRFQCARGRCSWHRLCYVKDNNNTAVCFLRVVFVCVCCCDSTLIPNILDSNDFKHLHN